MAKCKLFDSWIWGLTLPAPFDASSVKKRTSDVYSKYNNSTTHQASLNAPMLNALLSYATLLNAAEDGKPLDNLGAIGFQGDTYIAAEYYENPSTEAVIFNRKNGKFYTSIFADGDSTPKAYTISDKEENGSALLFALMPLFNEDEEFADNFNTFRFHCKNSFSDLNAATDTAFILCDNMYRRIENAIALKDAGISLNIPATGNITQYTERALKQGTYSPDTVLYGKFSIVTVGARPATTAAAYDLNTLVGKFCISSRQFTEEEKRLIPELPSWYVVSKEVMRVCEHIQKTTGSAAPIRNIMFRGPAGTGKTEAAKAIAAGLGLPYMFLTCSANTEVYDLLGQILPETPDQNTSELTANLPTMEDIRMDPSTAYCEMTGIYAPSITEEEVLTKMVELAVERAGEKDGGNRFVYVETPLVKALRYGYLIEIQEPTVISNPGVLVGLNALLDNCKSITLPNGKRLERHPDTVIVVTTNTSYEGCKDINQSVISRMNLIVNLDPPDLATTVKRVLGITKCPDRATVKKMAKVVNAIAQHCRETMITDGSCGIRELIAWVQSFMITSDPYEAALYTVISSATADPENMEEIINTCLTPHFEMKA